MLRWAKSLAAVTSSRNSFHQSMRSRYPYTAFPSLFRTYYARAIRDQFPAWSRQSRNAGPVPADRSRMKQAIGTAHRRDEGNPSMNRSTARHRCWSVRCGRRRCVCLRVTMLSLQDPAIACPRSLNLHRPLPIEIQVFSGTALIVASGAIRVNDYGRRLSVGLPIFWR
jgi:hypothetical protein